MEGFMRLRKFENELKVVLPRIWMIPQPKRKTRKLSFGLLDDTIN